MAAVLATLMTIPFVVQRVKVKELSRENEGMRARLRALQVEMETLKETLPAERPSESSAVGKEQLLELMRLRAEVGELRRQTNIAKAPAAPAAAAKTNAEDLKVAPIKAEAQTSGVRPPWRNAGYAQPLDAASTVVWAMQQGQIETVLSGMTPEAQEELRQQIAAGTVTPQKLQTEAQTMTEIRLSPNHPSTATETFVIAQIITAPQALAAEERMEVNGRIVEPGQPYTQNAQRAEAVIKLQKVGDQWLFAGKVQ